MAVLRFARSRGALGEAAFARLRSLRFAVVGCGRIGSLVAEQIASYRGAGLVLIDPDRLEPHNLGEMAGRLDDALGRPKASALAEGLAWDAARSTITAIPAPVQALHSLFAVKEADVVITCPDQQAARLAVSWLAALYLKPVLDLGRGIVRAEGGRGMGLDVRLLLPGCCLNCVGGNAGHPPERLGSLRSLNTWAVGLAFTLLEQFVAGHVPAGAWLQGDVTASGVSQLGQASLRPRPFCTICRNLGRGDAGLNDVPRELAA